MANNQFSGGWRFGGPSSNQFFRQSEEVDNELLKRAAAYNTPKGLLDAATQADPIDKALTSSPSSGGRDKPEASDWDKASDAEKAKYYAENPTMASITQMGQRMFAGINPYGMADLQARMDPAMAARQGLIAQGINPADAASQGRAYSGMQANDFGTPGWSAAVNAMADARQARQGSSDQEAMGGTDGYGGIGNTGSGFANAGAGDYSAAGLAAAFGGKDGADGFADGGFVTRGLLSGPNPKGPDDGYAGLDEGEFVLKKSAVKKLGRGLLDRLNKV